MSPFIDINYKLKCPECHREFAVDQVQTYCPDCRSPLVTEYDLAGLRKTLDQEEIRHRTRGMWRWRELLPVRDARFMISLGEGDTPLLKVPRLAEACGARDLLVKDESLNPTGSFKARGLAAAVSKAVELGLRDFVIPTAGTPAVHWLITPGGLAAMRMSSCQGYSCTHPV